MSSNIFGYILTGIACSLGVYTLFMIGLMILGAQRQRTGFHGRFRNYKKPLLVTKLGDDH